MMMIINISTVRVIVLMSIREQAVSILIEMIVTDRWAVANRVAVAVEVDDLS